MTTNQNPDAGNYLLLGRLQQDCEYYLGNGNRAKKHLWAGDEVEQIKKMKDLFASLAQKPEWITAEEIARYEVAMISNVEEVDPEGRNEQPRG